MLDLQKILSSDDSGITIEKINRNFQQISTAGGGPMGIPGYQGFPGLPAKDGEDGSKGDVGETGTRFTAFSNSSIGDFPPTALTVEQALLNGQIEGDVWLNVDENLYFTLPVQPNNSWLSKSVSYTVDELMFKSSDAGFGGLVKNAYFDNSYLGDNDPENIDDQAEIDRLFNTTIAISSYMIRSTEDVQAIYIKPNFTHRIGGAWPRQTFKFQIDQRSRAGDPETDTGTGLYNGSIPIDEFTPLLYLGEYFDDTADLAGFGILSYTYGEQNVIGEYKKQIFSIQGKSTLDSEFYFAGAKVWSEGDFISIWSTTIPKPNKNIGGVSTSATDNESLWFGTLAYENALPFSDVIRNTGMKISKGSNIATLDFYTSNDIANNTQNLALSIDENRDSIFNGNISVGVNGGGDTVINLYDDNSNVYRPLIWDDSLNDLFIDGDKIYHDGNTHTHDDRYYTESESNSRFVNVTGDTMSGALLLGDSIRLNLGNSADQEIFNNGLNTYFDLNTGGWIYFRDGNSANNARFSFEINTGNLTMDGTLASGNDITAVDNITAGDNVVAGELMSAGTSITAGTNVIVGGHIGLSNGFISPDADESSGGIYVMSGGNVGIRNTGNASYALYVSGHIYSLDNMYADDFITTSDLRLKNDVTYDLSEISIDNLKPISYKIKGEFQYGFGAQDMLKTHPDLVVGTGKELEDGEIDYYSIKLNSIIALNTNEIQKLKEENKKIPKLESDIELLKIEIENIKKLINK